MNRPTRSARLTLSSLSLARFHCLAQLGFDRIGSRTGWHQQERCDHSQRVALSYGYSKSRAHQPELSKVWSLPCQAQQDVPVAGSSHREPGRIALLRQRKSALTSLLST